MEQHTGSPAAKLVLVKLADNANEDGFCFPSVALIVEHTELSDRTVRQHLRQLDAAGLIRINRRVTNRGAGRSTYQLNVPWLGEAKKPTNAGLAVPAKPAGGAQGMAAAADRSRKTSPSQKMNLQVEPSLNLPETTSAEHRVAALPLKARADALINAIGKPQFDTWFLDAEIVEGSPYTIVAESPFKANWIQTRFGTTLRQLFGDDVTVTTRAKPAPGVAEMESAA
jgi:DNA-binding transcriptional ArsR family regulator